MKELFLIPNTSYNYIRVAERLRNNGFERTFRTGFCLAKFDVYVDLRNGSGKHLRVMAEDFLDTRKYGVLEQVVDMLSPRQIVDGGNKPYYPELLK